MLRFTRYDYWQGLWSFLLGSLFFQCSATTPLYGSSASIPIEEQQSLGDDRVACQSLTVKNDIVSLKVRVIHEKGCVIVYIKCNYELCILILLL
jgi:hypothetical protein